MISSIILAAGMSTRMGEPKALLDWHGEPLISYQVNQLKEAGADEVVVVLGHRADEISRPMRRLPVRIMLNPRYQMGRAGSLQIGAKAANRDADTIIILNVDQPRPASFIKNLLDEHAKSGKLITRPVYDGHGGHPVIVSGALREELMAASDATEGLRGILQRHSEQQHEVPSTELARLDLNTPEDYQRALEFLAPA